MAKQGRVDSGRIVAALATAVFALLATTGVASDDGPAPARQRELVHLLRQDCGSCHGLALTGGLGPALTPEALRQRPYDGLVAAIVRGLAGSAMPSWRRFITEVEARWLVDRMLAGDTDDAR